MAGGGNYPITGVIFFFGGGGGWVVPISDFSKVGRYEIVTLLAVKSAKQEAILFCSEVTVGNLRSYNDYGNENVP